MSEESSPPQSKAHYAHFERFEPVFLLDLYDRHAEVARDIHQNSLRRFANDLTLEVDLVYMSAASPDREALDEMQKYDVVSSSTEISNIGIIGASGPARYQNVKMYQEYFDTHEMPVFVTVAGNNGETEMLQSPRVADFLRTSLVVGEASRDENNVPYVEKHSSQINPTLVSDSPFNHDHRYRLFAPPETLSGHEELIRDWLVDREITKRFNEALSQREVNGPLTDMEKISLHNVVSGVLEAEGYPQSDLVNEKIAHFLETPEDLHAIVMSEVSLNSGGVIDAQGYSTASDGTSFSTPELAGYVSGAHYEQLLRAEEGKPTLSKEEISALVKIATIDVEHREGENDVLHQFNNAANYSFSAPGGHGLFQPEMFRKLVDEAYERIESNPNIDRENVVVTMHGTSDFSKNATQKIELHSDLGNGNEIVMERSQLEFDLFSPSKSRSYFATVEKPDDDANAMPSRFESAHGAGPLSAGWLRQETVFGETLKGGENWSVSISDGHQAVIQNIDMTVYGFNKGGLMDQMMQYGKSLEAQYDVSPTAPEIDNASATLPAMKN